MDTDSRHLSSVVGIGSDGNCLSLVNPRNNQYEARRSIFLALSSFHGLTRLFLLVHPAKLRIYGLSGQAPQTTPVHPLFDSPIASAIGDGLYDCGRVSVMDDLVDSEPYGLPRTSGWSTDLRVLRRVRVRKPWVHDPRQLPPRRLPASRHLVTTKLDFD